MSGMSGMMASIENYYQGDKYKWLEGLGEIITGDMNRETIAFRTAMMPGLSITLEGAGLWSLTHDESGMKLHGEYERLADAVTVADELASRIDWRGIVIKDVPNQKIPHEMFDLLFEIECTAMDIQDRIDAAMDGSGGGELEEYLEGKSIQGREGLEP